MKIVFVQELIARSEPESFSKKSFLEDNVEVDAFWNVCVLTLNTWNGSAHSIWFNITGDYAQDSKNQKRMDHFKREENVRFKIVQFCFA